MSTRPERQPPVSLLQELLELPTEDARQSLTAAATIVSRWLDCDKTDVFLFDESRTSLVAMGTSRTPLGERQRALGLDVMALAQGGGPCACFRRGSLTTMVTWTRTRKSCGASCASSVSART